MADLTCPFCNDDNFDRIGLKLHLQRGWCDAFDETPTTDRPEPVKPPTDPIYRGTCPNGHRCLHGCHHDEPCWGGRDTSGVPGTFNDQLKEN